MLVPLAIVAAIAYGTFEVVFTLKTYANAMTCE